MEKGEKSPEEKLQILRRRYYTYVCICMYIHIYIYIYI